MMKAKVWGKQVKTPSAIMSSKKHTKMMATPENKAHRQKGVEAMKSALGTGAVKGRKPSDAVKSIGGSMKAGIVVPKKGILKGEERKFYKMTGHTGMKTTKLPRRSK